MAEATHQSALQQNVATLVSTMEQLLETLKDLSDREFETLRQPLYHLFDPIFPLKVRRSADVQGFVFSVVESCGRKSVDLITRYLKYINREDLVQKLSSSSSEPKKKQPVDKHLSALIHKVAMMIATKELLLETIKGLSHEEVNNFRWLLQFTLFKRNLPHISWRRLLVTNGKRVLVDVMVEMCGQQSVDLTMAIVIDMNRTDLVQMLSEDSLGPKEKYSVDEDWPALIQKVEMMASIIELLLETLKGFSGAMLQFKDALMSQTDLYKHVPHTPEILLHMIDIQDIVLLIVQIYGQRSVEMIMLALKKMNNMDRVQKLSEWSSGPQKKHSADKQHSALIQRVATLAAVKELLFETLKDLSEKDLEKFKEVLRVIFHQKNLRDISPELSFIANRLKIVDQMVKTYGQQCVELTREAFMDMKRPDLVQRLPLPSSRLKEKQSLDEHQPAWFEGASAVPAVKHVLLGILNNLDYWEFERFKGFLQFTYFQKSLPQISASNLQWADSADILVDLMVVNQQPVEVTEEVLMDMNRTDLVQRLSLISSGVKVRHQSALHQKEAPTASDQRKLLETLEELSSSELKRFKHVLQYMDMKKGLPRIPSSIMEMACRADIVKLMVEVYSKHSMEVIGEVLKVLNKPDLMNRLSDISSGSKELEEPGLCFITSIKTKSNSSSQGPSRSMELEGCSSTVKDSVDWTKLEPEVNSTDADEAPTYSLHSEAGKFECSASGLRWFCKEKVSLKIQFCSWEEPMERIGSMKYMPAGPLIDITVISGHLIEVYLPHWICTEDIPKILDKFAVLHIDDCGDVVEKVSEVTSSHVKLSEPIFSPRAALMKAGFPVKISCKVLIYYKPNVPFLKLHVYLIPHDPALKETVDKMEFSEGFEKIQKPRPDKFLRMYQGFSLRADIESAKIQPEKITLRYDSQDPNFYEVFIENPDRNFHLMLFQKNKDKPRCGPIWTCEIHKDDFQTSAHFEEKHSVDEQLSVQMQKAATITTDRERLLKTLEHLKEDEFIKFKWYLKDQSVLEGFPRIPNCELDKGSMLDLVDLMLQTYRQQFVELTKRVLKNINRNDLVHTL